LTIWWAQVVAWTTVLAAWANAGEMAQLTMIIDH
jgi:hypothetical protein